MYEEEKTAHRPVITCAPCGLKTPTKAQGRKNESSRASRALLEGSTVARALWRGTSQKQRKVHGEAAEMRPISKPQKGSGLKHPEHAGGGKESWRGKHEPHCTSLKCVCQSPVATLLLGTKASQDCSRSCLVLLMSLRVH